MEELKQFLAVHDTELSLKLKQLVDQSEKLKFDDSLTFNERTFFESCYYGDEAVVRRMIDRGVDVNLRDCHNKSAAHWTVEGKKEECAEILKLLKDHGTDFNVLNSDGLTPLHVAIISGKQWLVHILIELGANVNLKICKVYTPLYVAICLKWNKPWVSPDINSNDNDYEGTNYERCEIIEYLITTQDIEFEDFTLMKQELSYFRYAALYGDDETVKVCCKKFHNSNMILLNELPYLMVGGCTEIIDSIPLPLGNMSCPKTNETPLHLAVKLHCIESVAILVDNGVDCNDVDNQNSSSLHIALKNINQTIQTIKIREKCELRCIKMQQVIDDVKKEGFGENYNLAMVVYMIKYGNANPFLSNNNFKIYIDFIPGNDADKLKIVNYFYKVERQRYGEVEELLNSQKRKFEENMCCIICATGHKAVAFDCGHLSCENCSEQIYRCHICRQPITKRLRLFFS